MPYTLVIGSGIAGLTSALLLAKEGQQVAVIEQQARPGGLLQTYRRAGHSLATGLHYMGLLGDNDFLGRLWGYLDLSGDLTFLPLTEEGGELIYIGGKVIRLSNNKAKLEKEFLTLFPNDRGIIEAYFRQMEETVSRFALYRLNPPKGQEIGPNESTSLLHWLEQQKASKDFINTISYLSFLYGLSPAECPLYVHLIIHDSFLRGAWRLKGGGKSLINSFLKKLAAYDVNIRTNARLAALYPHEGSLVAELQSGEQLMAEKVIYTGDIGALPAILKEPKDKRTALFLKRIGEQNYTAGMAGVGIAFAGNAASAQNADFLRHNHYIYLPDFLAAMPQFLREIVTTSQTPWLFISAEEAGSAQLLLPVPQAISQNWPSPGEPAYKELKEELAEALIKVALVALPELKKAKIIDTFTPFTYERYLGIRSGSAYGLAKNIDQLSSARFTAKTRIPGLYLAGQSILLPGIVGASISALSAALEILGPKLLCKIK